MNLWRGLVSVADDEGSADGGWGCCSRIYDLERGIDREYRVDDRGDDRVRGIIYGKFFARPEFHGLQYARILCCRILYDMAGL